MFSLSEIMDLKVLLNSIKQCHQNSISGLHGDNGSIRGVQVAKLGRKVPE